MANQNIRIRLKAFDHRLIDGALGDQFTGRVKQILENWSEEVL